MSDRRRWALLLAACAAVVMTLMPPSAEEASACAFDPRRPWAYEADQNRAAYNLTFDAVSSNRLFEGDAFFALPGIERGERGRRTSGPAFIPSVLLKAISWTESDMTMALPSVPFLSIGEGLVSFDCGHGLMQVTTGMTVPLGANGQPSDRQALIATHYAYNIARGAQLLAEKWNAAPEQRPIVGTDTDSDPALIENWYYAVWGYNGFTGPGSNQSNHPLDPSRGPMPRPAYRCDGTQSRTRYPYQELVWGCLANPPSRNGTALWERVPATLPDMGHRATFNAMSLSNWQSPYNRMDIETPEPAHLIVAPSLPSNYRTTILGAPSLRASTERIEVRLDNPSSAGRSTVAIQNVGTGVMTWIAESSANYVVVTPPGGVSVGSGVACTSATCPSGQINIEINPTLLPSSAASATVTVRSPNGGAGTVTIRVDVVADFEVGAPGTSLAR